MKDNEINRGEQGYWQDVEQKELDPKVIKDEFKEGELTEFSPSKSRRDFLKIVGFSFSAIPAVSCMRIPTQKIIPFLHKNDQIVPGVATWFTTKYDGCNCGAPLILKTREGRPIKVEGNDKSTWTKGGACAVCQASVLELYDSYRLKNPLRNNTIISWGDFNSNIVSALLNAKKSGKKIALITNEYRSPSVASLYKEFIATYKNVNHLVYRLQGYSSVAKSLEITHGKTGFIEYNILNTDLVVGVSADFLGTMDSSTAYSKQYAQRRDVSLGKKPIRHVQIESNISFTGTSSDERIALNQYDLAVFMMALLEQLGGEKTSGVEYSIEVQDAVKKVAAELLSHKGNSLLICGENDVSLQVIANKINTLLNNWGTTLNAYASDYYAASNDEAFEKWLDEVQKANDYEVAIFVDVNPAYNYYNKEKFSSALKKIPTTVSLTYFQDETSALSTFVAPIHHSYESWNDYAISSSELAIGQAVINPLHDTKQTQDIVLGFMEKNISYYDYIRENWNKTFLKKQSKYLTFDGFWDNAVQTGVVEINGHANILKSNSVSISKELNSLKTVLAKRQVANGHFGLVLYQSLAMRDGKHANNPWLQEMPDPITKLTWDNALLISPATAKELSLKTGDLVDLESGGHKINVPVIAQPGIAKKTLSLAFGYGREVSGKVGAKVGHDANPFVQFINGSYQTLNSEVTISKTGKTYNLALTQTHHSMEGRDIVRETTFGEYKNNPKAGNEKKTKLITMWSEHKKDGHQWAMAIDLSKCNGCTACVVSCNAENNIPVVGRQEVFNRREMHWMRIDRYYKGSDETPSVVYQPMTCQHCDNAPCETVCPVLATVHSSDGLNQQVYNRCVGTRYCANNCPYKVRRFNWFDYPRNDLSENMVLNPDVVVRSRGVMEKCSMCIQRIQEAKLNAKKEGRELKDGEIKLACQQSCSSDAIMFGDINDPKSKISEWLKDPRNYAVLDELNVRPRVSYLTKIRNKD